jgi:hypothetical protein
MCWPACRDDDESSTSSWGFVEAVIQVRVSFEDIRLRSLVE